MTTEVRTDPRATFAAHYDWALRVAAVVARGLPACTPVEDIHSPALEGLWDAAQRWDGCRDFRRYAGRRIRGSIRDYLRSLLPVGQRRRGAICARIWPLGAYLQNHPGYQLHDLAVPSPSAALTTADEVRHLLLPLPPQSRRILSLSLLEGKRQREIARSLGLTEGRVSQIITASLAWLRSYWQRRKKDTL